MSHPLGVPDSQNSQVVCLFDDLGHTPFFRITDKYNLAFFQVRERLGLPDGQFPCTDRLALVCFKGVTERILAQDTEIDERTGIPIGLHGPIDKLEEIVDEGRFDLVFRRFGSCRRSDRSVTQGAPQQSMIRTKRIFFKFLSIRFNKH